MARKKKKKNAPQQAFFTFPDYMEVTPEDEKVIKQIKNPFIFTYGVATLSLLAGLVLLLMGLFSSGLMQIYYYIFAAAGAVYAVTEFYFTIKKNLAFNKFIKRKQYRIIWIYSDEKYEDFYNGIKNSNDSSSKRNLLFVVILMAIMMVLLYFSMEEGMRITAIPFGLICIGVVLITGFFFPWTYLYDARRKPYISLIDDDGAYALGRFYTWEKAHVKFGVLNKSYGIDATEMRITYQEPSLFGKKTPTFQVLIPNNEQYTLQYARRVGKRINQTRKLLNETSQTKDDFMDKAFRKMLGQGEE